MNIKLPVTLLALLFILLATGCSNEGANDDNTTNNDSTEEEVAEEKHTAKKPPVLNLLIGEDTIKKAPAGYSWSYYDTTEETMVSVETETLPPANYLDIDNGGKNVTPNTEIQLNFEEPPTDYEVRVWDADNNIVATYDEIDFSNHKGITLYEIRANWEQGNAGYLFSVNIRG